MGWATRLIEKLRAGETVQCRPHGRSMSGRIESGQLCTIAPIDGDPDVGDIVLAKVNGRQYLHLVKAKRGDQYQIANNRGHVNGWVSRGCVYGRCVRIEP